MPKFRVYRYYVGCHVYDVEADTAQQAQQRLDEWGDAGDGVDFLHEANDPGENQFFTEVMPYGEDGFETGEVAFTYNPACAKFWRGMQYDD
jgi:hypothetical protein